MEVRPTETRFTLTFVNPTPHAIEYLGTASAPVPQVEVLEGRWWLPHGWTCYSGAEFHMVPAGRTLELTHTVPDSEYPRSFRIVLAGFASEALTPPSPYEKFDAGDIPTAAGAALNFLGRQTSEDDENWVWVFELQNPHDTPLRYLGQGPRQPGYVVQQGEDSREPAPNGPGGWLTPYGKDTRAPEQEWEVPPGSVVRFQIPPLAFFVWSRVCVEVDGEGSDRSLWSEPIPPRT